MKEYHNIKDAIFEELYQIALKDPRVVVFSVDNGAMMFKEFKKNIPAQFFNVGIAEQNAISAAAGMALTGRHVFVYGITNFMSLRCFEQIKIDLCFMKLPVTILAVGTGYAYSEEGPTHHATENITLLRTLPGMTLWNPADCATAAELVHVAHKTNGPSCIMFDKDLPPSIDKNSQSPNFSEGLTVLKQGKDVTIIGTGVMVLRALAISDELKKSGVEAKVIDIYQLKPINKKLLFDAIKESKKIVTLEEHSLIGGLSGIIFEFLSQNSLLIPVKSFGLPDKFNEAIGNREFLKSLDGIDDTSVVHAIETFIKS